MFLAKIVKFKTILDLELVHLPYALFQIGAYIH